MNKNKYLRRLVFVSLCLFSALGFASFDVIQEGDIDYYGNATIPPFKEAVTGEDVLNARDRAFLDSVEEIRIINRWYLRALLGNPRVKLKDNTVTFFAPSGAQAAITTPNIEDNLLQFLLAWGYLWENWSLEAELMFSKKMNVNLLELPNGLSAEAELKQYALFFNAQYILPHWWEFYPSRLQIHFDAGFGPAYKSTDMNVTLPTGAPGESESHSKVTLAGNLGFGGRYQITPYLLVDVVYRYFQLGSVSFKPVNSLEFKSDQLKSFGLFFGFTYQY